MKALKAKAELEFGFENQKKARAVYSALKPERELPGSSRCRVEVGLRKRVLCLRVEAQDTVALRAAVNSFVRLLKVAKESVEGCEKWKKFRHSSGISWPSTSSSSNRRRRS